MVDYDLLYQLAHATYLSGNYQKALPLFQQLTISEPLEGRGWFGAAACQQQSGQFESALMSWAMIALLDAENPYPHLHAAECLIELGQKEEAQKAAREAKTRAVNDGNLLSKIELLL